MPILRMPVVLHANYPHANCPHANRPHANYPSTRESGHGHVIDSGRRQMNAMCEQFYSISYATVPGLRVIKLTLAVAVIGYNVAERGKKRRSTVWHPCVCA